MFRWVIDISNIQPPLRLITIDVSLTGMRRYTNIPLPDELAQQIEDVIKTADFGYKTKSEFVKEAVREKLVELGKFKGFKKKN